MSHLGPIVVETVIQLADARDECRSWRMLTEQALAIIAERDRELKAARDTIAHQRLELRAIVSGRTIGEQRQADKDTVAA